MGKPKKARVPFYNHHDGPARKRADRSPPPSKGNKQKNSKNGKQSGASQKQNQHQQRNQLPVIPFKKTDRILLVGEG